MPPKKPRKISNLAWFLIVVALLVGIGIGHAGAGSTATTTADATTANQSTTPAPTQAPTKPPVPKTWQTTHTYSGNGTKKTETITVPSDWKLKWTCDPTTFYGGSYNVIIDVNASNGTPVDPAAVNSLCASGNTSGETEERQSGQVYFDVNSEAAWTITVQELK